MQKLDLTEHTLESKDEYQGRLLHVKKDRVRLPDGNESTREYVVHPGAAVILPIFENGDILLERQHRYPLHRDFLELPAGKFDPNESELVCAKRELQEETGYAANEWARAGVIHPVISYSTEFIEIWVARHLVHGARQLDAGEFLDVFTATPSELMQWCMDGTITDAKTICGALWLQNMLSGSWQPAWQPGVRR